MHSKSDGGEKNPSREFIDAVKNEIDKAGIQISLVVADFAYHICSTI